MENNLSPLAKLVGLEILVPDLGVALDFFHGVLAFPIAWRGPAADSIGEIAVLDVGDVALTLFSPSVPAGVPEGTVADRRPRLSQLVMTGVDGQSDRLAELLRSKGMTVQPTGEGRSYVPPEVFEGVVGFPVALSMSDVVSGET